MTGAFLAVSLLITTAQTPLGEFRWGGDAEGGSPFVEADPRDPSRLTGFDVEIAELIAGELNRRPVFIQITFTSLDQSARRGDFEIGLSGIEDTPARRAGLAVTVPYYEFREVLDGPARRRANVPQPGRSPRPPSGDARWDDRLRPPAGGTAEPRHHGGVIRRRRASVLGPGDPSCRRRVARSRAGRARHETRRRPDHASERDCRRTIRGRAWA